MSWLARSLANSLKLDGEDEEDKDINSKNRESPRIATEEKEGHRHSIETSSDSPGRGVKEDLSEITKTLTRQLWGVASFLAPPPSERSPHSLLSPRPANQISSSDPSVSEWNRWESSDQSVSDPENSDSIGISGVRSDFAEIGGKFRSGISKISTNRAVSEISKIASNLLPFGSERHSVEGYPIGGAVGVTDEVLAFARNIAMHPETWLDFPMDEDEELDDFDMSDAQQEHALAVEHLAPRLAALRIELCPGHMSEGCFWKIYFVLLHSRLNKHDAELLSTPQVVNARALWMQELQKRTKPGVDWSRKGTSYVKEDPNPLQECVSVSSNAQSKNMSLNTFAFDAVPATSVTDFKTEKHPVISSNTEMQIVDKKVVEEGPATQVQTKNLIGGASSKFVDQTHEEDGDDWLQDENSEMDGYSGTNIPLGNEEDVSFSDLEEDDDGNVHTGSKTATHGLDSATKDSPGWVQLSRSSANSDKNGQSINTANHGTEQLHANNRETKESNDWLNVDDIDVV